MTQGALSGSRVLGQLEGSGGGSRPVKGSWVAQRVLGCSRGPVASQDKSLEYFRNFCILSIFLALMFIHLKLFTCC